MNPSFVGEMAVTAGPCDRVVTAPLDRERLRHAKLMGAASGMKGVVHADVERAERLRVDWPELWERVVVTALIDW